MISKNNWPDMHIFRLLVFCIFFLLIPGCNSDREFRRKYLLDKEEMVNILVEINLANALQGSPDFYKVSRAYDSIDIYAVIFKKYGIEKAAFDTSLAYYTRKPQVLLQIYDEVIMRLNQIQDTIKEKK
jgi:hypothetical protein